MVYVRSANPDVSGRDMTKTASKNNVLYKNDTKLESAQLEVLISGTQFSRDMKQIAKCYERIRSIAFPLTIRQVH